MSDRGRPRSFDRDVALQKAMEVFWARGYAGASMAELTGAMGISPPSLYAAFGSKADLYRQAMDRYVATSGAALWGLLEEPTARAGVAKALRTAAQAMVRPDQPLGCMVALSSAQPEDFDAELQQDMTTVWQGSKTALLNRLVRAQAAGEIAADADLDAIALFYATVHQGMSLQARQGATADELNRLVTAAMAAWEPMTQGSVRHQAGAIGEGEQGHDDPAIHH